MFETTNKYNIDMDIDGYWWIRMNNDVYEWKIPSPPLRDFTTKLYASHSGVLNMNWGTEYVVWFIGGTVTLRNSAWITRYTFIMIDGSNGQTVKPYPGEHQNTWDLWMFIPNRWNRDPPPFRNEPCWVRSRVPDPKVLQYVTWGIDFRKDGWKCWQHQ